jgi:hypothetical protein
MYECLYGWSDLLRFLTSQKFKKITYSRSRFDLPNTLVETHEHHYAHGLLLFVNNMPRANVMSGCLSKYFFTSGCLSKIFKVLRWKFDHNKVWSNYFTHWNEWIHYLEHTIVYEWLWKIIWLVQRYSCSNQGWIVVCTY